MSAPIVLLLGPDAGVYRGSTSPAFPVVKGNGVLALTDRRIAIRRAVGRPIDVPIARIRGVRGDPWFRRSTRLGRPHVIVTLDDGGEVAFSVPDIGTWIRAINDAVAR